MHIIYKVYKNETKEQIYRGQLWIIIVEILYINNLLDELDQNYRTYYMSLHSHSEIQNLTEKITLRFYFVLHLYNRWGNFEKFL